MKSCTAQIIQEIPELPYLLCPLCPKGATPMNNVIKIY